MEHHRSLPWARHRGLTCGHRRAHSDTHPASTSACGRSSGSAAERCERDRRDDRCEGEEQYRDRVSVHRSTIVSRGYEVTASRHQTLLSVPIRKDSSLRQTREWGRTYVLVW